MLQVLENTSKSVKSEQTRVNGKCKDLKSKRGVYLKTLIANNKMAEIVGKNACHVA